MPSEHSVQFDYASLIALKLLTTCYDKRNVGGPNESTIISIMGNDHKEFRSGYVAIVGEPNVGKSTLLNALLKQKISIVTRKPQTTRQRVLGVLTEDDFQIVFQDTPGLLEPRYLLQESMIRSAEVALADADVILTLTEVSRGAELSDFILKRVLDRFAEKAHILVINKVDLVARAEVLPIIDAFAKQGIFKEIVPISALKQENLDDLLRTIRAYIPLSPPFYPPDIVSEHPERFFVAEIIREKIFERFQEEVPYSTAIEIREYKERENGKTFISADVIVERDSQKGILIGKKGIALKQIGSQARSQIEAFIGREIFLDLHVRVEENWRRKKPVLRRLGYDPEP